MPPRPSLASASNADQAAASSSTSSTIDPPADDPKTMELREFAVTALESFEMQAVVSFTNDISLAAARRQLIKRLIGIHPADGTSNPRQTAGGEHSASGDGRGLENSDDESLQEANSQSRGPRGPRR
ncbi:hypothetical protein DRE_00015 [Drechslerella stenobrocha 248]|uniref:Uncharacterized protein n=1 Tax=Drechslerella stenobrocha 248 TaxID=1043628 RepID=W7IHH6_9PEZI|nr:hypothetical protein DRE_00015 [Drechslerella stenobrocha 248]